MVGGIGLASTVDYYLGLINLCRRERGQDVYPKIVIDSVDMTEHIEAFSKGDYDKICDLLIESLDALKSAGAEIAAVTANTEHIVWDRACSRFPLPVISIVDEVVTHIKHCGYKRVLVFGTEFTMTSGLYEKAFIKNGIIPIIPDDEDKEIIGNLIYPNLENGIVIPEDKVKMIELAEKYIEAQNADSMLLGCTEIPLMLSDEDISVPTLKSTDIHINAIYRYAEG